MSNRYKKLIPVAAILMIAFGVNLERFGIDLHQIAGIESQQQASQPAGNATASGNSSAQDLASLKHWSDTNPAINQHHVYLGEINRKGKPVGFHSRPAGQDPDGARLVDIRSGPNRHGVYTATIAIRDGSQWKEKFSSFFPDDWSVDEVNQAILHAYQNSGNPNSQPWSGPSGHGFEIQGYTASRGDINTAFPVFQP